MKIHSYINKDEEIVRMCKGKRVLHYGCVGFTDCAPERKIILAKNSLHAKLSAVCDCVGIDYDKGVIEEMRNAEIFDNVIYGNVEKLSEIENDIGKFDVIVAGDIIEHLSNPGLMLDGTKQFLKEGGDFVVSTPNSFGVPAYLRFLRGKFVEGDEHVLCFNPITLKQLLNRHGFKVDLADSCYQGIANKKYGMKFKFLRNMLERFPKLGGTLLYVCSDDAH